MIESKLAGGQGIVPVVAAEGRRGGRRHRRRPDGRAARVGERSKAERGAEPEKLVAAPKPAKKALKTTRGQEAGGKKTAAKTTAKKTTTEDRGGQGRGAMAPLYRLTVFAARCGDVGTLTGIRGGGAPGRAAPCCPQAARPQGALDHRESPMTDTSAPVSSGDLAPERPGHLPLSVLRRRSLDEARIQSLLAEEWKRFEAQTPGSAAHHHAPLSPLPMGVPSSFQHWDPYPVAITSARAPGSPTSTAASCSTSPWASARCSSATSTLRSSRPSSGALETGTLFVTPSPSATEAAERFQRRFGLDQLRFANSGTEATMYALRTARAFTGRKAIIKIEGGYHGGYDACRCR